MASVPHLTVLLLTFTVLAIEALPTARPDSRPIVRDQYTTSTPEPPPVPYKYAFAAGRAPGGKPDRFVEQEGDDKGVIRGSYTYLDPNWNWHKVGYIADDEGFHITDSSPNSQPEDTPAVKAAKEKHKELFDRIAERHRVAAEARKQGIEPDVSDVLDDAEAAGETDAVKQKRAEHVADFKRIAAEHKRIAAEQSRLSSLALAFGEIYERK